MSLYTEEERIQLQQRKLRIFLEAFVPLAAQNGELITQKARAWIRSLLEHR